MSRSSAAADLGGKNRRGHVVSVETASSVGGKAVRLWPISDKQGNRCLKSGQRGEINNNNL